MSFWSRLLDTAKDVAPSLAGAAATAAGGPAIGAIVAAAARKAVGAGDEASVEDVAQQVLGDPEALQRFRFAMRRAELEELRIRTQDTADARRALRVSKGAVWVSLFVTAAYSAAVVLVMTVAIPAGSESLAYLVLGNLGTGFGMVLTFWLGSSVGSKEKEQTLAIYAEAAKRDQK
jgi:hypothetical protein